MDTFDYMEAHLPDDGEEARKARAIKNFRLCLEHELGMSAVNKRTELVQGTFLIGSLGRTISVMVHLDDREWVDKVIQMFAEPEFRAVYGLPFDKENLYQFDRWQVPSGYEGRRKAGKGFGINKYRVNEKHKGWEISFGGKPSDEIRAAIKNAGFRWNMKDGVWYIPIKKFSEQEMERLANLIGVTKEVA